MRILLWVMALATAITIAKADEKRLVPFAIEDQFGTVHRHTDFANTVVVVIGSDRHGSAFNEAWGEAIAETMKDEPGFESVRFLPVAHLRGVPFFLKRMIRGRFPEEPEKWALVDWKGLFAESYGFVEGATNILVFSRGGELAYKAHGRGIDRNTLNSVCNSIRRVLTRP